MRTSHAPSTIGAPREQSRNATTGEVLENLGMIEIVRDITRTDGLHLLHWDGRKASVVPHLELNGQIFQAAAIDPTVLRAMPLPTQIKPCGSVRQLLDDISRLLTVFAAMDEHFARVVGRFMLSSWVIEALPAAPSLRVVGPETIARGQLLDILAGLCRHALRLTGLDVAGILSLPLEMHPTLVIRQSELKPRLQRLLESTRRPREYIPHGGRLVEFHSAVATFSEFGSPDSEGFVGIEIPSAPPHRKEEILGKEPLRRITEEFQNKLLWYRCEHYANVCDSKFDVPQFLCPTRDFARSLGACTPGDADLQAELVHMLEALALQVRSARWTDLVVVVIEALLGFVHEEQKIVYVGDIAKAAEAILAGRGEMRDVTAREVGEKLRDLRIKTEERDCKGFRLLLTQSIARHVHELARDYDAPAIEQPIAGCPYCTSLAGSTD
jgi:hypothetical protein